MKINPSCGRRQPGINRPEGKPEAVYAPGSWLLYTSLPEALKERGWEIQEFIEESGSWLAVSEEAVYKRQVQRSPLPALPGPSLPVSVFPWEPSWEKELERRRAIPSLRFFT